MLRPIRFQCIEVWVLGGLSRIYVYSCPYSYVIPTCAGPFPNVNGCVSRRVCGHHRSSIQDFYPLGY